MKVLNVHKRVINQPKEIMADLIKTLATNNDKIWPNDRWPVMKLNQGLKQGSKGGHGPIRYFIQRYIPGELILFEFSKPSGFNGVHRFEVTEIAKDSTELKHTIDMNATGIGMLTWVIAIRWLHNALVEDAFDKVENQFSDKKKQTDWGLWVKILRTLLK